MVGRTRGFTLIELLVVLLLMGIVVSFAVLSVGDERARELEKEAWRLARLLQLASEESILQSQEFGVRFEKGGYEFLAFKNGRWSEIQAKVLRKRDIQEKHDLTLQLFQDGLPVVLEGGGAENVPQIVLFPGGERSEPFEVRLEMEEGPVTWAITVPVIGSPTVSRVTQ